MKITVLADNKASETLRGEWGLSFYIEYRDKKLLLDTGQSSLFLKNAKEIGIDLSEVDFAVLSHAHYDHADGMETFFKNNTKAMFYLRESTAPNCYDRIFFFYKYVGIRKNVQEDYKDRIIYTKGKYKLSEGIYLLPHTLSGMEEIGKREKMYRKVNKKMVIDNFSHEQSLVFETKKGLVIFNSCSHGGAANIIKETAMAFPEQKVYGMIGGFHLFNKKEWEIEDLAKKIKATEISYVCTGHCTGQRAYNILEDELKGTLHQLRTGLVWEMEE